MLPTKAAIGSLICNGAIGHLCKWLRPSISRGGLTLDISSDVVPATAAAGLCLGMIERAERRMLRKVLDRSAPVIELGAGLGSISQEIASHVDRDCPIFLVEANSLLGAWWSSNLNQSERRNVRFASIAASANNGGEVAFRTDKAIFGSHVTNDAETGIVRVPASSISEIYRSSGFASFSLICDIEGAEFSLLQEANCSGPR